MLIVGELGGGGLKQNQLVAADRAHSGTSCEMGLGQRLNEGALGGPPGPGSWRVL